MKISTLVLNLEYCQGYSVVLHPPLFTYHALITAGIEGHSYSFYATSEEEYEDFRTAYREKKSWEIEGNKIVHD